MLNPALYLTSPPAAGFYSPTDAFLYLDRTTDILYVRNEDGTTTALTAGAGGLVPASDITPGTFGAGNYVFPGNLDVDGVATFDSGVNVINTVAALIALQSTLVGSALVSFSTHGTLRWNVGVQPGTGDYTFNNTGDAPQLTITQSAGATFAANVRVGVGSDLQLGRARVAGAAVQGGTITILDSSGATVTLLTT